MKRLDDEKIDSIITETMKASQEAASLPSDEVSDTMAVGFMISQNQVLQLQLLKEIRNLLEAK